MTSTIGNYKGIMLCNRPFGGETTATRGGGNGEPPSFSCGVVPEAIGISVSVLSKEKHKVLRPKKDSALTKHKKWLAQLQETKDKLELQYAMEMEKKQETRDKFQEREARHRDALRKAEVKGVVEAEESKPETQEYVAEAKETGGDRENTPVVAAKASQKRGKSKAKPVWLVPPSEGKEDVEEAGSKEEEALLSFVKDLNFDKFVGDLEVKTMMERVRDRIRVLEREVQVEVDREKELEVLRPELSEDDEVYSEEEEERDSVLDAAKDLLHKVADMGTVHSTKSIAAIMARTVKKEGGGGFEATVVNEPVVASHDPAEGSRLDAKKLLANLPYMHRNPAV